MPTVATRNIPRQTSSLHVFFKFFFLSKLEDIWTKFLHPKLCLSDEAIFHLSLRVTRQKFIIKGNACGLFIPHLERTVVRLDVDEFVMPFRFLKKRL
jgi:hypothetical protein